MAQLNRYWTLALASALASSTVTFLYMCSSMKQLRACYKAASKVFVITMIANALLIFAMKGVDGAPAAIPRDMM